MKNFEMYNKWTDFITSEKYKKYFLSNEDEWLNNLWLIDGLRAIDLMIVG